MPRVFISFKPADEPLLGRLITLPKNRFKHFSVVPADVDEPLFALLQTLPQFKVHQSNFSAYLPILRALDRFGDVECPSVSNISLSPGPGRFDRTEPVNAATHALANKGHVLVIAAGNDGPEPKTLSPWSMAPWVIGVGATTDDGLGLLEMSSTGDPEEASARPTVVAPGRTIVPLRENGPSAHGTMAGLVLLGKDIAGQHEPGMVDVEFTGTSVSTPRVARLCNFTLLLLRLFFALDLILKKRIKHGTPGEVADICTTWLAQERIDDDSLLQKFSPADLRSVLGFLGKLSSAGVYSGILPTPAEVSPLPVSLIQRLLVAMALPMPGYAPHQVGAGFVNESIWTGFMLKFSEADMIRLLYSDPPPVPLAAADFHQPLFSAPLIARVKQIHNDEIRTIAAKVL